MRELRLGTRGSPLAIAQSRQVAAALQAVHEDLHVRLVPIDTRGDRDRDTPLARVRDGNFFSAEIDAALLAGHVDLAVHSRKDLEGPRPPGISQAAMPARANPQDVVLFHPAVMDRLRNGERLRIGTSSMRRALHVRSFLERALPQLDHPPRLECRPLRGPVDQRLRRISGESDRELDGVVLALAGLARLWADPDGRAAIAPRLGGLRWMVLPLSQCPTAPGQGALSIECRSEDASTRNAVSVLHDPVTAADVEAEYAAATAGTNALQPQVGATALSVPRLGRLLFARTSGDDPCQLRWSAPPPPMAPRAWDGGAWHRACRHRSLDPSMTLPQRPAIFVAHWRALQPQADVHPDQRIWVSGWQSWQQLSAAGLWIEGCADGLGFDALRPTLATGVLQLPSLDNWLVLTRAGAEPTWQDSGMGQVMGTYAMDPPAHADLERLRSEAQQATHFFWSSREQFAALRDYLPGDARHACGSGKTYDALMEIGARPHAFPNREAWQTWLS